MRAIYALSGAGLALALFAAAGTVASAKSGDAEKCSVTVDRSGAANSYNLSQQKLDGGGCVCYITTGSGTQSDAVEKKISAVQANPNCGGNHDAFPLWVLGAGAGAGGIIAALATHHHHNDSTGG